MEATSLFLQEGTGQVHLQESIRSICRWSLSSPSLVSPRLQATVATALIRDSSICTGAGVAELKCQGPCGLVLALDSFSKQARCNGGSNWCLACTGWKEAAEPGVTTVRVQDQQRRSISDIYKAPAVSTDIAPDEQDVSESRISTSLGPFRSWEHIY